MSPERLRQVEELFHSARVRPAEERAELLAQADAELRREVESLLSQDGGEGVLDRPAMEVAAKLLEDSSAERLAVGAQLGPYRIESSIGAGGMGQVYKARDTRLGRAVAMKVSSKQFNARFEREARAISALNHPHICTLYDVAPDYLVMELVEGETLADRLLKGPLPREKVARYGAEIADALAAAHAHGVIHRDLKPGNIMLTKTGMKVLDFGVAKFARPDGAAKESEKLTSERAILGTLAYMAPEQLAGRECDARSDIYSFGLVLYEMLTGKRASEGGSAANLEWEAEPFPGVDVLPLDRVVRKCLAKDPEERWQSARDLKTNLEWAGRGPGLERQTKIRPSTLVLGIAAAALAIVAVIGWFTRPRSDMLQAHFVLSPPEGTRIALRLPTQPLVL